jgi:hypothetical protein
MRQIATIIILALNLSQAFGQKMTKEQLEVVTDFIDCVKHKKMERLTSKISFPFDREYPLPPVKDRQDFLTRYNEIFDQHLINLITSSNPDKDWSEMGWRGIMLLDGEVWLDYDGRLISINYQSDFEKNKREQLIETEKSALHVSIRNFKQPVHVLETANYKLRIDDMGDQNYRFAVWKIQSKMIDKPDFVIEGGEYKPDGSGGNHRFEFHRKDYTYECSIIVMGEKGSPPAYFTAYKADKELFSEKANIVER